MVDTTAPVITVNGANPMTVECHTSFTDPGATASDGCAGNFPAIASRALNVNVPCTYTITYAASDLLG
ncbi:MAG: immunoglobulin-like domain-containing protein [Pyrinomonadaceae bacterium]